MRRSQNDDAKHASQPLKYDKKAENSLYQLVTYGRSARWGCPPRSPLARRHGPICTGVFFLAAADRSFHESLVAAKPANPVWGSDRPRSRAEGPVPDAAWLSRVLLA
jgi:hypothetical protein